MITVALGAFIFGIFAGLGIGRFFCKWHHKEDAMGCEQLPGDCCKGDCEK